MNIYKLNSQEVNKLHSEFNKTFFGKRATLFSMLPLLGVIVSIIFTCVEVIENNDVFNYFSIYFGLLNLALLGIAQLQYSNMLKEFAQSKKDKE